MSVVIFGGTSLARALAQQLDAAGVPVWTSLAGATRRPRELAGRVRTGGFGSDEATAAWLAEVEASAIVDATHSFAAAMTERLWQLTGITGIETLRLEEASWAERPDAGWWRWAPDHATAAAIIDESHSLVTPGSVFLTVGRQELGAYASVTYRPIVARMVDAPEVVPDGWQVVTQRGPFTADQEREFCAAHDVGLIVAKDAGGSATAAKLDVAAERDILVLMVMRPPVTHELDIARTVPGAMAWLTDVTGHRW